MTHAIGYIRVSTVEQADSGLGMTAQQDRIEAYCKMRGMTLDRIIDDPGVSGGKPLAKRPGGADLLDALSRKRARAVIVLKLDRAFRNAADCLATVERWDKDGVALHIVDLGGSSIDSTTAAGKFMLTVLAGAAEMERNLTAERTKAALAVKRANGQRISRTPYGFDVGPDGRSLVENPAEQAVIADILAMRDRGMSMPKIAEALTARGVPTKRGNGAWRHETIGGLIRRHANIGGAGLLTIMQP